MFPFFHDDFILSKTWLHLRAYYPTKKFNNFFNFRSKSGFKTDEQKRNVYKKPKSKNWKWLHFQDILTTLYILMHCNNTSIQPIRWGPFSEGAP